MRATPHWKVQYLDNVIPELMEPPPVPTEANEEAICSAGVDTHRNQQPQVHHSTTLDHQIRLQARLDKLERPLLERKYEPWHPFPSCAVPSHRRLYREQEFPYQAADHMGRVQALRKFDEYKSQKLEECVQAKKPHQPKNVPQAAFSLIVNARAEANINQPTEQNKVSAQQGKEKLGQIKENNTDIVTKSSRNLDRGLQQRKYPTQRPHMYGRRSSKQIFSQRSNNRRQNANEVVLSFDSTAVSSGPASLADLDFAAARIKLRQRFDLAEACALPLPESFPPTSVQSKSPLSSVLNKLSVGCPSDMSGRPDSASTQIRCSQRIAVITVPADVGPMKSQHLGPFIDNVSQLQSEASPTHSRQTLATQPPTTSDPKKETVRGGNALDSNRKDYFVSVISGVKHCSQSLPDIPPFSPTENTIGVSGLIQDNNTNNEDCSPPISREFPSSSTLATSSAPWVLFSSLRNIPSGAATGQTKSATLSCGNSLIGTGSLNCYRMDLDACDSPKEPSFQRLPVGNSIHAHEFAAIKRPNPRPRSKSIDITCLHHRPGFLCWDNLYWTPNDKDGLRKPREAVHKYLEHSI